ncbi:MAG: hypothetical protein P8100_04030 [bacterium]
MKSSILLFIGFLLSLNICNQPVIKNGNLEFISGKINTCYSTGYREKAEYLKQLIEDAVYYYEYVLRDTFSFELYVLDRETWKGISKAPYPIPHFVNHENRMILPVISFYKIHLSDGDSIYGNNYYYLSDFIAIHELGHYITHQQDAKSHSKWSGEFFADFTLIAYLHEIIPGYKFDDGAAELFTFLPLKYKSLERFGSAGVLNELAYHPKFQELADQIYNKEGINFMFRWLDIYQQLNKDIKNGKYDHVTVTSEQVFQHSIKNIQNFEPVLFSEWNKSMRQTYHPWLILFGLMILIGIIRMSDTSYSLFKSLDLKTKRIDKIFGIPVIRIWVNVKNIRSKRIQYKLIRMSTLRILNVLLITILILFLALSLT